MFIRLEEKMLLCYYNRFYKRYFIKNKKFNLLSKEINNKSIWKSDLDNLISLITGIYLDYFKNQDEIKKEKYKMKVKIDSCNNTNLDNYVVLVITVGLTFISAYYSMKYISIDDYKIAGVTLLIAIFLYHNLTRLCNKLYLYEISFYKLCLNILEDLESELKRVQLINNEVATQYISEIAATKEIEAQSAGQVNGNWNVEISTLSVIDAIESIYRVGKFVRKMFTRKK